MRLVLLRETEYANTSMTLAHEWSRAGQRAPGINSCISVILGHIPPLPAKQRHMEQVVYATPHFVFQNKPCCMRKERKLPRLLQKTEDPLAEADGPDRDFMLVRCAAVAIAMLRQA